MLGRVQPVLNLGHVQNDKQASCGQALIFMDAQGLQRGHSRVLDAQAETLTKATKSPFQAHVFV